MGWRSRAGHGAGERAGAGHRRRADGDGGHRAGAALHLRAAGGGNAAALGNDLYQQIVRKESTSFATL